MKDEEQERYICITFNNVKIEWKKVGGYDPNTCGMGRVENVKILKILFSGPMYRHRILVHLNVKHYNTNSISMQIYKTRSILFIAEPVRSFNSCAV